MRSSDDGQATKGDPESQLDRHMKGTSGLLRVLEALKKTGRKGDGTLGVTRRDFSSGRTRRQWRALGERDNKALSGCTKLSIKTMDARSGTSRGAQ